MKKKYILEQLDCANCAMKIERKLNKLPQVQEANVDFAQKKLWITYTGDQTEELIIKTVLDLEPDVVMKEIKPENDEHHHEHTTCEYCEEHHHHDHDACSDHTHEERNERILQGAEKLYITGLDCANCAAKIESYVQSMEGVKDASLNFSTGVLFVEVSTKQKDALLDQIIQVVPKLEDGVQIQREKVETEKKARLFSIKENYRLYIGIIIFAIAILFNDQPYVFWIYLLAYVAAGSRVVYTAIRNILRGEVFDENFLMSVATIGAFAVQSYKEAVAVMIFYEIGEMFQSYAVHRSRKSISSLMDIRSDYATLLIEGEEKQVTPEEVKIGDTIIVKPGERVPLDGVVLQGQSALDTSALTGESMPRNVEQGDEVLAGVVNLQGVLQVQVQKEAQESTVARILELVENASSKKAPMEKFITRFARVYTPTVVVLAILVAVLPVLFIEGAQFHDWLYRALTFLVVSCPCALVISVPLGMFAGIGAASKQGILIKGGNYLEALKNIDTVVFDKTGTLTKGNFALQEIHAQQGSEEQVLQFASYGEFYSQHPIAVSISEAYGQKMNAEELAHYEEVAGNGIQVQYKNKPLLVGNHKLMEKYQITYERIKAAGTIVYVAYDGIYQGYLLIADQVKETSKQGIVALKNNGVKKCVMLSGDSQEAGIAVAKELALDEVHMQLLPADKVEKVEALLAQESKGHKLAFVGDGINDAPVLARADIGVAMGGIGSDAAIEAADVVLMKDDPASLSVAMRIAKKTMHILWQNIIFSLGVKIVILLLTVLGYSDMWMGVFADVGVTLLAVLNSMRALKVD